MVMESRDRVCYKNGDISGNGLGACREKGETKAFRDLDLSHNELSPNRKMDNACMESPETEFLLTIANGCCTLTLIVPALVLMALTTRSLKSKYENLIHKWADDNGYRIVQLEARLFGSPWFPWHIGRCIYLVALEDGQGHLRKAWLRSVGIFRGLDSAIVELVWNDEKASGKRQKYYFKGNDAGPPRWELIHLPYRRH
jgi:hypothetical protein